LIRKSIPQEIESMISKVVYKGDLRTEATHLASGKTIITDAPVDNEGKGEAFSPTDLVATALASCIITVMGIVARRNDIEMDETTAEIEKIMSVNPKRISEKDRKKLEHAAHACPVGKSLHQDLKEEVEFIYP